MNCPLCLKSKINHYHKDKVRDYWQCLNCQLVFVKPQDLLNSKDEKSVYDRHENSVEDLGYQKFLNKLLIPLTKRLKKGDVGLDFGSGPGPTISKMMEKKGFKVNNFDVYYANNLDVFNQQYDFITCTEVIEHLYNPNKEITKLCHALKDKGYLGIMTKRLISLEKFKTWHYKNDPTHGCFYSDETFKYIASQWRFVLDFINADTVILKKISYKI
jgi:2-polyprenyl-3-methyl-5-hydroxy-6-metoxy-1,4-benzoquinol methylase